MTVIGWFQTLLYCAIIVAIVPFLGGYMTRVFNGDRTLLSPVLQPQWNSRELAAPARRPIWTGGAAL